MKSIFTGFLLASALAYTNANASPVHQQKPRVHIDPFNEVFIEGTSSNTTESFLNIRFGQDTSGPNRFAPPKPYSYPSGTVVNATSTGAACPQQKSPIPDFPIFDNVTDVSEDCLTLRVDRPVNTRSSDKLPVMVWIYGGGDTIGQIYDSTYDPSNLIAGAVEKGTPVIYVAMNYRLGIFGFAASPALNATDSLNAGLLDQRLALEWIQEYIAAFGGDPENVTIFGESDGATGVGLQITAYGAQHTNLFKRGIMESGNAIADLGIARGTSAKHTATLTKLLNCTASTSEEELSCLRSLPLKTLLAEAIDYEFSVNSDGGMDVFVPTAPSSFIPDSPHKLLSSGRFARNIDIISGWNENDGSFFVTTDPTTIRTNNDVAEVILGEAPGLSSENVAKALALYPISDFPSDSSQNITAQYFRASRILRDMEFTCGNLFTTEMNQKYSNPDTSSYLYSLNQTMFEVVLELENLSYYQVCHFSDIPYVFNLATTSWADIATASDIRLSSQISGSWASFASLGNPSVSRGSLPRWTEAMNSDGTYNINVIGGSIRGMVTSDTYEDLGKRCAFWTSEEVLTEMLD
ncbi:carboxylesterase [Penicillium malachiteum]|uniref:carboxylesterase n=1 Tax=Penicillium malachiteum TaxID=1324776 RepID=UPI0025481DB9|nr:carboxylesterase [Penicillium malachiteum]KAJ5726740.1 carboxylesterase [Penicillium malachiteum]